MTLLCRAPRLRSSLRIQQLLAEYCTRGIILFDAANEHVLAAFAHPDDAELACFGTLALFRDQ
jgi:hypothetical protein